MIKQVTIFLSILFISTLSLQAQQSNPYANVIWGPEYQEPNRSLVSNIIGSDKDGFYALRMQGHGQPYLEHYYYDLKLRKSAEMEINYKGKIQKLEDIILFNDELYMLTSYNNEPKKTNYLFLQGIFKNTFTLKGDMKVIGEIPSRNRNNTGAFDFSISRDSSKLMIYYGMPYKKFENERFAFRVMDEKMEQLWYKEIALPYSDQLFEIVEFRVDGRGDVYLLGKLYNEVPKERKAGKPNYQYVILAYLDKGETEKQYKISFEQKFIQDLAFRIDRQGDIVCAGFYSNFGKDGIKGTVFFRINAKTQELYNTGTKEFDDRFLSMFLTDRQLKKGKELYKYDLRKLIMRSDGGAVLVGEQYDVDYQYYRDYYTGQYIENYYYYYNDIIVTNINPDGTVAWAINIPKRQVTVNDGGYFSSYAMSVVRDRLYFIFNDHPKNVLEKEVTRIRNYNGKSSMVTLAVVGADGQYDKVPLFSNKDADVLTRPKICKQSGRDEMLIYGERNKKYKFGRVSFAKP